MKTPLCPPAVPASRWQPMPWRETGAPAPRRNAAGALQRGLSAGDDDLARARDQVRYLGTLLRALDALVDGAATLQSDALRQRLQGRGMLVIGGRPGTNRTLKTLVLAHGGTWLQHAGGLDGHEHELQCLLVQAHQAWVPADYLDDESLDELAAFCAQRGVRLQRLRGDGTAAVLAQWLRSDGC